MKRPNSAKPTTTILLLALTLFSLSCQTPPLETESLPAPPPPNPAVLQRVEFVSIENGQLLTPEEYRKLELNIIEMRRYIAELENVLALYTGEFHGTE